MNESIVQCHAEDVGYTWSTRTDALGSIRYDHCAMMRLDERLDAHLDGLRLAGEVGWRFCLDQLRNWRESGETFAAASLAFDTLERSRLEFVLGYGGRRAETRSAIVSALGWRPWSGIELQLSTWLTSEDPVCRYLAVAGFAVHRRDPGPGLACALQDATPEVRGRAAQAVGELGRHDLTNGLRMLLDDEDEVGFAAARSLTRLAAIDDAVRDILIRHAESGRPWAANAVHSLVRSQPAEGPRYIDHWLRQHPRLALEAVAALADPHYVPELLGLASDPSLARTAGRVFSTLTGLELADHELELDGPTIPDEDEDEMTDDPDQGLPWPSPLALARCWRALSGTFDAGHRYLGGKVIGTLRGEQTDAGPELRALAIHGPPAIRIAAAFELGCKEPTRPTIEVRAPFSRGHALPGVEAWVKDSVAEADGPDPLRSARAN